MLTQANDVLPAALQYLEMGFSIFPCRIDKRPAVASWLPQQEKAPSREQAETWWGNGSGSPIALVTGKVSGLVVVDVDDEDIGFKNLARYISPGIVTPMVRTPTGGYHLYFKDPGIDVRNNARAIPGCDFRGNGGYVICPPSHCEYQKNGKYISGKYTWVKSIFDTPLAPLPQAYLEFINSSSVWAKTPEDANQLHEFFAEGRRDEDLFRLANLMVKGGIDAPFVDAVLTRVVSSWGEHDPKWVQTKIRSALERANRKERNLADEVREWVVSSNGVFLSSDVVRDLGLSSRVDRKNLSKILERLKTEGVIDRHGERRGCYRLRDTNLLSMDIMKPFESCVDVAWPLDLDSLFVTLPRNIIIVAGEPESGKTAFLLNFVRSNMSRFEIHYFNSEMGETELTSRLSKFSIPLQNWQRVHWWERSDQFSDVIRPDAVNVIDFLEITDEFWKIGTWIKEIHDRLRKGIAVIAIQKKPGTDTGRGGYVTLEKPRLYLTMEPGKVKIKKAKNWRQDDINPNGLELNFKLVKGCQFMIEQPWQKSEPQPPSRAKSYGDFAAEDRARKRP